MNVATVDVDVRLFLRLDASVLTGQHEGVESNGALRPPRVDLLNLVLQLSSTLEATTSFVMYREVTVIETIYFARALAVFRKQLKPHLFRQHYVA